MVYNPDYEVSSEGAVRHWEVPYARLESAVPLASEAAALISRIPGTQITGTVLVADAGTSIAVVDVTCSMVYRHWVRNVITYNAGNENAWAAINIGDPVYWDDSNTMPAAVFLSTSPLSRTAAANPLFGHVVPADIPDMASFPHGAGQAGSTHELAVMQIGAGG